MNIIQETTSVLVGMSGGVDSSVTVGLLLSQGYDISGLTITPFKIDESCKIEEGAKSCCNKQSLLDAIDMAEKFGIKHYLSEMTDVFEQTVVSNFVSEYMSGRTPNPCVICNPTIKWKALLDKADELGIRYIATGHYASIRYDDQLGRSVLCKAKDSQKDQTYFLWRLSSDDIQRTIFPLGELTKPEVRQLADEYNLIVKNKPDSQEICFVPNNDYREFLVKYLHRDLETPGDFMLRGKIIGKHRGYPFYTVGQRKGLGLSYSEPLYVQSIDPILNIIHVETIDNIANAVIYAKDIVLSKYSSLDEAKEFDVKIRYRDPGTPAICEVIGDTLKVTLRTPKNSIAIGQSIVMYEGDDVVGGGVIDRVE